MYLTTTAPIWKTGGDEHNVRTEPKPATVLFARPGSVRDRRLHQMQDEGRDLGSGNRVSDTETLLWTSNATSALLGKLDLAFPKKLVP